MHRALIALVIHLTPQFNPNILHTLIFRAREVRVICYYNRVDTVTASCIIIAYYDTSFDLPWNSYIGRQVYPVKISSLYIVLLAI